MFTSFRSECPPRKTSCTSWFFALPSLSSELQRVLASNWKTTTFVRQGEAHCRKGRPSSAFTTAASSRTAMRILHGFIEQERFGHRRHLTTTTTLRATTHQTLVLNLGEKYVAHITLAANQLLKAHYRYTSFLIPFTMSTFFVQWALWEKMTFVSSHSRLRTTATDNASVSGLQS